MDQIRTLNLTECQALAQQALTMDTAAEVRALSPDPWAEASTTDAGAGR